MPQLLYDEPESLKLTEPLPLSRHPAAVYLASLGKGSQRTMRYALNKMAGIVTNGECDYLTLDWSKLRYTHTAEIRRLLRQQLAPATVNKMLCALRRVLQEAYRLDLMEAKDYTKAIDFPNVPGERHLRGRALSSTEIAALMRGCEEAGDLQAVRDLALIAILRGGGLRRTEVVRLQLEDLDLATGALQVRQTKGEKSRTVYLPEDAIDYVEDWLDVRGWQPGPLICPIRRGGHIQNYPLSSDGLRQILKLRAQQVGVEDFSPHDFRRTFCGDLLEAGVDIVTVQKLVGHSSPTVTAKYDRRGEETKRKAVQKLQMPPRQKKVGE